MAILMNIVQPILFISSSSFERSQLDYFFKQTDIADAKFLHSTQKTRGWTRALKGEFTQALIN